MHLNPWHNLFLFDGAKYANIFCISFSKTGSLTIKLLMGFRPSFDIFGSFAIIYCCNYPVQKKQVCILSITILLSSWYKRNFLFQRREMCHQKKQIINRLQSVLELLLNSHLFPKIYFLNFFQDFQEGSSYFIVILVIFPVCFIGF